MTITRPPLLDIDAHLQNRQTRQPLQRSSRGRSPGAGGRWGQLIPGLALAVSAAAVALVINLVVPSLSALLVAIALGMAVSNTGWLPAVAAPGLAFASRQLLRVGIILLGLQLSFGDVAELGFGVFGVAVAVVAGGFLVSEVVGRWLGLRPAQRLLIGAGMSICGAAAVAAVDDALEDHEDHQNQDAVTAVALVVLFGTVLIGVLPAIAAALQLTAVQGGQWAGASIQEVAQVVAAGGVIGGAALKSAIVVKLARVLLLAPVIAVLGLRARRAGVVRADGHRPPIVPLFVAGFLLAAMLRTTGWVPQAVLEPAQLTQTFLLAAGMFGLGCGVKLSALRRVGARPVVLGAVTTVAVGAIGLCGVLLLG